MPSSPDKRSKVCFSREQFYGHNWSATPIGPFDQWPDQLKHSVNLILDSMQPMFLLWGPDRLLLFNSAFCEILGENYALALGSPLRGLWSEIWIDIEPHVEDAFAGRAKLVENKPFRTWSSNYDEVRCFTFSYSPIRNPDGSIPGAICIASDTTESVRAAESAISDRDRLRALFDQAPVFLAMGSTPDMRINYVNRAYSVLLGREVPAGASVSDVIPEAAEQGYLQLLHEVHQSGKPYVGRDMRFVTTGPDGSVEHYIDFIFQPIFDSDGAVEGILCVGSDVTDEHRARERALLLQDQLNRAARVTAMGTMAATLAHEMNQPLAAAGNYLSGGRRMAERIGGTEGSLLLTALNGATDQVHRCGEIVKRARDALSKREPVRTVVALGELVDHSLELARASGSLSHKVAVQKKIDEDAQVLADPVQIEQVLSNLVRNASTAMLDGGELTISCKRVGHQVEIGVCDTGPGIEEALLRELFSPFVQSNSGGMGIGLSICRTIVEAQGGHIWAEPSPSGGAAFYFTLPLAS